MHSVKLPQLEIISCIERFGDHGLNASCPASVQKVITHESARRISRVAEGGDSSIPRNAKVFPIPFKAILNQTKRWQDRRIRLYQGKASGFVINEEDHTTSSQASRPSPPSHSCGEKFGLANCLALERRTLPRLHHYMRDHRTEILNAIGEESHSAN